MCVRDEKGVFICPNSKSKKNERSCNNVQENQDRIKEQARKTAKNQWKIARFSAKMD